MYSINRSTRANVGHHPAHGYIGQETCPGGPTSTFARPLVPRVHALAVHDGVSLAGLLFLFIFLISSFPFFMGSRIGRSTEHRVANERTFITLKGYPRNFVWFSVDSKLKGEGGRVAVEPVGREERLCICVLFYEAKGFVFWDGNLTTATCCYYYNYYYLLRVNPHDYYLGLARSF